MGGSASKNDKEFREQKIGPCRVDGLMLNKENAPMKKIGSAILNLCTEQLFMSFLVVIITAAINVIQIAKSLIRKWECLWKSFISPLFK